MKYGENDESSYGKTRRKFIRSKPSPRSVFRSNRMDRGTYRLKIPIRWITVSLSDIGECEIYVYDSDYLYRKPCFYMKALNGPFKTCIEVFDNKYVEEAAKDKLTNKQAEELYNALNKDVVLPDCISFADPSNSTLYDYVKDMWITFTDDRHYLFNELKDWSNIKDIYGDRIDTLYKHPIPDYKLLNKEGDNNGKSKQNRKYGRRKHTH